MDTNKFFSFSRIAMVMKREIMENWKTNLYRLIGIYAAFALVMVLTMSKQVTYSDSQMAFQHYCSNIMGTFAFIIGIFGIVYAANIMENMITKEKRIAFLMLPATMIEKFVARFLIVTVGLLRLSLLRRHWRKLPVICYFLYLMCLKHSINLFCITFFLCFRQMVSRHTEAMP